MKAKRIIAVLLAAALSVSAFSGCGINKSATVATFGDGTKVSLGLVNFIVRYKQAIYGDVYMAYYGEDSWNTDLYGIGYTLGDTTKDTAIEEAHELYTLSRSENMEKYGVSITDADKKAISEAAAKFMSDNSKETISEMGATQEIVEEMITLYTVSERMKVAIKALADTEVSDEEANMRGYSMVSISIGESDEEKTSAEEEAKAFAAAVAEQGLDEAAEAKDYTVTKATYAADNTTLAEEVKTALDGMKEGEVSGLITTDSKYYVVRLDAETDEEATESHRESIISTRQSDKYSEILKEMQTDDGWTVKEKTLEKITFKNNFTTTDPNAVADTQATESVETTEAQ